MEGQDLNNNQNSVELKIEMEGQNPDNDQNAMELDTDIEGQDPNNGSGNNDEEQEEEDFIIIFDNERANLPVVRTNENVAQYCGYPSRSSSMSSNASAVNQSETATVYPDVIPPNMYIKFQQHFTLSFFYFYGLAITNTIL